MLNEHIALPSPHSNGNETIFPHTPPETNTNYLCTAMALCLAILTSQDDDRLIPLVVEHRGILNKTMAMQNICKLFPLIRNNVLRGGRKGLNAQENLIRLRNYGSVVLNDRNNLMLFQGHYRNILDDTATLVAISEHSKNPFECHCTLEKLEHIVMQCYSNRSNRETPNSQHIHVLKRCTESCSCC